MEPMFGEFDRVFTVNFGKLQKGSVVVFKHDGKYLIKRVKALENGCAVLSADNKKLSKAEYKVRCTDIIGRVILKY